MSSALKGEPGRQAIAPIGGILYQIWQSVFAWISLGSSEVLYLEGAEDFDVIGPTQATAVQVRRTATPISLGSAKRQSSSIFDLVQCRILTPSSAPPLPCHAGVPGFVG
jgi:hypothetical protein